MNFPPGGKADRAIGQGKLGAAQKFHCSGPEQRDLDLLYQLEREFADGISADVIVRALFVYFFYR
ncbi:MAG: hypothetical protein QHC65_10425 [Sphingomonas sp.]|nr:hypothetical protein [Sphingomonas sp.]MDX3884827.1 hypothetical protein [Sphingomonas sp.]